MEINDNRKREIAELAEYIANEYCPSTIVDPEIIARGSGITFNYGEYGDAFDGLLEHESGDFHIYLNTNNIHTKDRSRIRFSFAHELGHYFIDEHRNALCKGQSLHRSFYRLTRKNVIELEADCFASNLLMPTDRFVRMAKSRVFDFSLVESLANHFGVSLSATLLKLIETNAYPLLVVFSKGNRITRHWRTPDFPYKMFKDHYSGNLPALTVAGDYFNHGTKCEDTEVVNAIDWFTSYQDISGKTLYEKCIYPTFNNTVISILWE